MRVLQIGSIAGVPQELSRAQRRLGLKSDVISFQPHQFNYEVDLYRPTRLPIPFRYCERMRSLFKLAGDYDIFHFHWSSAIPFGLDLPIWKKLDKKIILHYHGDDVRGKGSRCFHSMFADRILVSTPDLLEWSPNAVFVPNPINLEKFQYVGVKAHPGSVKIIHAPSDRLVKGTEYIIKAVEGLKADGYDVELILVENMPYQQAVELYREADVVVDQLIVGWYGSFAVECMALGKPVCVYIRQDLLSYFQEMPMVNTSPSRLENDLRRLLEDIGALQDMSRKVRKYAEQVHDSEKIAQKLVAEIY
jgi:glycosyltransferase involved in cell wall biosynthesis